MILLDFAITSLRMGDLMNDERCYEILTFVLLICFLLWNCWCIRLQNPVTDFRKCNRWYENKLYCHHWILHYGNYYSFPLFYLIEIYIYKFIFTFMPIEYDASEARWTRVSVKIDRVVFVLQICEQTCPDMCETNPL